jgi:hypothetical protein
VQANRTAKRIISKSREKKSIRIKQNAKHTIIRYNEHPHTFIYIHNFITTNKTYLVQTVYDILFHSVWMQSVHHLCQLLLNTRKKNRHNSCIKILTIMLQTTHTSMSINLFVNTNAKQAAVSVQQRCKLREIWRLHKLSEERKSKRLSHHCYTTRKIFFMISL